eukprot:COSAG02_NODE_7777_length_2850_cov_2.821156_3_plen_480_part_01
MDDANPDAPAARVGVGGGGGGADGSVDEDGDKRGAGDVGSSPRGRRDEGMAVRVRGCARSGCNGDFCYAGERNGRPCFTKQRGAGALYFDGTFWKICESGAGPDEQKWHYSQKPAHDSGEGAPPLYSWNKEQACQEEPPVDYGAVRLEYLSAEQAPASRARGGLDGGRNEGTDPLAKEAAAGLLRDRCAEQIRAYLLRKGKDDYTEGVVKTFKKAETEPNSWVNELEQLETEGVLDGFLDSCKKRERLERKRATKVKLQEMGEPTDVIDADIEMILSTLPPENEEATPAMAAAGGAAGGAAGPLCDSAALCQPAAPPPEAARKTKPLGCPDWATPCRDGAECIWMTSSKSSKSRTRHMESFWHPGFDDATRPAGCPEGMTPCSADCVWLRTAPGGPLVDQQKAHLEMFWHPSPAGCPEGMLACGWGSKCPYKAAHPDHVQAFWHPQNPKVALLAAIGFAEADCEAALRKTRGDVELASNW